MEDLRRITVGDMLEEIAKRFPTNQAVKYIEADYDRTYYDFNQDVDKIARGLMGMGFER